MLPGLEVTRGELAALVGVEDLWPAATIQYHLQGVKTELHVKTVKELTAVVEGFSEEEDFTGEQIDDRHQIKESILQTVESNVGEAGLIHHRDFHEIQETRETHEWIALNRGRGFC
jgi:hypothetical protein